MKTTYLIGVVATALLLPHAANAWQSPPARPLVVGHSDNITAFIAQHDGNGDGRLGWDEFDAFRRQRFDATDANRDGSVDVEEYVREFDARSRQAREQAREDQMIQTARRFEALDADRDGRVSRAEFDASGERVFAEGRKALERENTELAKSGDADTERVARAARRRSRMELPSAHTGDGFLALYDGNGDGQVDRAEFDRARAGQFERTDANRDGALEREEYLAEFRQRLDQHHAALGGGSDKQTRVRFAALDTDKNGRMTFAEYQVSGRRSFDGADRNHDGVVDAADAALPPPEQPSRTAAGR